MALTYRFYRAPQIGTPGSLPDAPRNKLTQYIVADGSGADFWDWIHDARPIRYTLARCESTVHDVIDNDPAIVPLSTELPDEAAVAGWLLLTAQSMPAGIQTQLENDGCNLGWLTLTTSRRALLQYLSRLHVMTHDLRRTRNSDSLQLFVRALGDRVSDLTPTQRQKVRDWMIAKGLDTSWITNQTFIRQVLHYIIENIQWPVLHFGPVVL